MSDTCFRRAHATMAIGLVPMALWFACAATLVSNRWLDFTVFFCLMGTGIFAYLCALVVSGFTAVRAIRRSARPTVLTWVLGGITLLVVMAPWVQGLTLRLFREL